MKNRLKDLDPTYKKKHTNKILTINEKQNAIIESRYTQISLTYCNNIISINISINVFTYQQMSLYIS